MNHIKYSKSTLFLTEAAMEVGSVADNAEDGIDKNLLRSIKKIN